MEKENKVQTIDIYPLSKGRRFLLFFCDYFLTFIATFFLFNVASFPLTKVISGYESKLNERYEQECLKDNILYDNNLLFYEDDYTKYNFDANMNYTFDRYLSYWVKHEDSFLSYEVIRNYFINIKNDTEAYSKAYYDNEIEGEFFFEYDSNHEPIKLADLYIDLFTPYFDSKDEMSQRGKEILNKFKNEFYAKAYARVFYDIEENDLIYDGYSYNALAKSINDINEFQKLTYTIASISAYVISWVGLFIVLPLINKNGKALSQIILKIERIGKNNMYLVHKGDVLICAFYSLILNASFVMFVPMMVVSFSYIFSLTILTTISLISLIFSLISIIFMLFNEFNRTFEDFLTQTIMISTDSLDEIYRNKGYDV